MKPFACRARRSTLALFSTIAVPALLASAVPPGARAQTDSTWREHNRAAALARQAQDWRGYRYHLERLDSLLGGRLPRVLLLRAGAEVRFGDPEAALRLLERYAAMGLAADVEADSTLAPVRALPGWPALRDRLARNAAPVRSGDTLVVLPTRDFLAEDIAWDARTRRLFVSSMRERRVVAVDRTGAIRDFVETAGEGLWAAIDLAVDVRRRLLWVTTTAVPFQVGYDSADAGRSALLAFDLATGRRVRRIDAPRDTVHFLADLTVAPTGEVYVADNGPQVVWVVRPGADTLEPLVPPGVLISPQTPALAPDGRRLFVPDYLLGIAVVDLATRRLDWLPRPADVAVNGIDGLYVAGQALVGVQNGTDRQRIVRFAVDAGFRRILGAEVLVQDPQLGEPTHCAPAGRTLYCIANSGDERARGNVLVEDPAARPPAIVRLPLPR